jgi:hypothetical protein
MTGTEQPDRQGSSDHGTLRDAVTVTRAAHPSDAALDRFLAERGGHLLRAAVLLTGSMQAGEDLVQAALEQVLPRWRTINGDPGPRCGAPYTTWPPMASGEDPPGCRNPQQVRPCGWWCERPPDRLGARSSPAARVYDVTWALLRCKRRRPR